MLTNVTKITISKKTGFLTPKGPRPFFCQKPLKTAISAAFTYKIPEKYFKKI